MRKISAQKMNAYVANQDIDAAILAAGKQSPYKTVHLAKIILRDSPTHKLNAFVPLYAFVKNVEDKLAVNIITNGTIALLDGSQIITASEVKGDFTIGGITYGIGDYINGFPRYKVKRT